MRELTLYEQMNVSGSASNAHNLSKFLGTMTAAVMAPFAPFIADYTCEPAFYNPDSIDSWFLTIAAIEGAAFFTGAALGGAVGSVFDQLGVHIPFEKINNA